MMFTKHSVIKTALNKIMFKQDIPFVKVLDSIRDSAVILDSQHRIVYHNLAFMQLVGGELSDSLISKEIWSFFATPNPYVDFMKMYGQFDEYSSDTNDVAIRSLNQSLVLAKVKFSHISNTLYSLIIEDLSKQKERETKLIKEAKSDKLTGLLNRKGFDERLVESLQGINSDSKYKLGILFIDLDEFKPINDTYGHDAGDQMLISVAQRLEAAIDSHETAARIGGDEFVCIFPVCDSRNDLYKKGLRILEAVAQPVITDGIQLIVQCSIGGAFMETGSETPEQLMKSADSAMYESKNAGKNQVTIAKETENL